MPDLTLSPHLITKLHRFASVYRKAPDEVLEYLRQQTPFFMTDAQLITRATWPDFPVAWMETADPEQLPSALAERQR